MIRKRNILYIRNLQLLLHYDVYQKYVQKLVVTLYTHIFVNDVQRNACHLPCHRCAGTFCFSTTWNMTELCQPWCDWFHQRLNNCFTNHRLAYELLEAKRKRILSREKWNFKVQYFRQQTIFNHVNVSSNVAIINHCTAAIDTVDIMGW